MAGVILSNGLQDPPTRNDVLYGGCKTLDPAVSQAEEQIG